MYHSVPKSVLLDEAYLKVIASHVRHDCHHIMDCAESNLPVLVRSEAHLHLDQIRQICPLLFPSPSMEDLVEFNEKQESDRAQSWSDIQEKASSFFKN